MEDLVICVDQKIVTIRKIIIMGWSVSKDMNPVDITTNIKKATVEKTQRLDIAHAHGCDDTYVGFKVETRTFRRLNITFTSGNKAKTLSYSCLNLRKKRFIQMVKKLGNTLKNRGIKTTFKMIVFRLQGKTYIEKNCGDYEKWYKNHCIDNENLERQKQKTFSYMPLISIIIPVYNTPLQYLKEVIDSVINQTYNHWELLLVDGKSTHLEIIEFMKQINHPKINVIWLDENKMISENTNAGIDKAKGEYIGLVDHDDLLTPDALYWMVEKLNEKKYDLLYSDEDKINSDSSHIFQPHFKSDFCIDTLRSYNYITHFTVLKRETLKQIGLFDSQCDGAQDYDMFLRFAAKTDNIAHIPKILYHWRVHENSTAQNFEAKNYVLEAGKRAVAKHLKSCNIKGTVADGLFPTAYRIYYDILKHPLISIIIPNKDHIKDLEKCINSIFEKTFYQNYEILIVENNSEDQSTFDYYDTIKNKNNIQILNWDSTFNYSAINNYAAKKALGEYLVLLNNDIEILTGTWLEEMLMFAQRADVGAVGAKLYYPNNTIQHAGVILGIGGVAGHSHKYFHREDDGYFGRLKIVQNVSAVTAACLMVRKSKFEEVGGLDEEYKVAFNDVDFCMKLLERGYRNVFTPFAEMIHHESLSRGAEDSPVKIERFNSEIKLFEKHWGLWREDPCYNKNLSITHEDFSLRK